MDRRERKADDEETTRIGLSALQSRLWTALPGIVQSFDATKRTVSVQPTINGRVRQKDGSFQSITMPVLLDCPVLFQGGGGVTATFPIKKGDECLVHFSARCIDGWFAKGGVQDAPEFRMHNLSDGFALVGVRSLPRKINVDTTNACLISDDAATFVKLDPNGQTVAVTAPGGINLNSVTIDSSGNMVIPGNADCKKTVTGETQVVAGTGGTAVHLTTHQHPTAATGSPSAPTPGT